jgi:2-haloacid dehalogenase
MSAAAPAGAGPGSGVTPQSRASRGTGSPDAAGFDAAALRVLAFDVFGTVVDWRGSIVREGEAWNAAQGRRIDWPSLADAWRAGYRPAMESVTVPGAEWADVDVLHRRILETLLPRFGLADLDEAQRVALNRVWHRLEPWADSAAGIAALKHRHIVTTLSNGSVALLVDLARHGALPWDCVLSSEFVRRYKPDPQVYRLVPRLFGVEAAQVLMVAAHPSDLRGAQRAGLRTALVRRPFEYGPNPDHRPPPDARAGDSFDIVADDLLDLARQLGA